MNRADDARARELAQSVFDRPVVLEAGAGTGKTTALVARVVAWILGPGWKSAERQLREESTGIPDDEELAAHILEGVVAITFTEAAAAEMETRVGIVLAQIAAGDLPGYLHTGLLPDEPNERSRRAECLLGALDRLQVRTIHSWCHRLLSRFPLEAGLHPEFQVDADGQHRREAANELIEEHLRRAYRDTVEPELLVLAQDGRGPRDLADALAELSAHGVRAEELSESAFSARRLGAFCADWLALLDQVDPQLLRVLRGIKRAKNAMLAGEWITTLAERLRSKPPLDAAGLQRLLDSLDETTSRATMSKLKQWSNGEFGKTETEALDPDQVEFLQGFAPRLRARATGLIELQPARLEAARAVLLPLLQELETRLHAAGVMSYEDLLRRTRALLDADNGVRQLLRDEIDQLLVDEFQDTNALQCEIVAQLALQGPPEKRPGLFLVGDPKQSIYGWRGAELGSYHRFVEAIEKEHGPRQFLAVNFRSVPAILREVERAVAPVMHERAGYQPAFQQLLPSEENEARDGYARGEHLPIEHWVSGMTFSPDLDPGGSGKATQLEARRLVSDLLQLQREGDEDFSWAQAGLLYRSGGDLEVYLRELRRAGIPYAVENDRQYYRRREIMDVVALVSCVLDPADQLAMVAFLRSPWVGVPDAAWLGLWRYDFPERFARLDEDENDTLAALDDCIQNAAAELPSARSPLVRIAGWDERLRDAIRQVASLRRSFQVDAPELFVRKLRQGTLVEAFEASRFLGPYRAANLERFFRLLRDALCELSEDPHALLRQLRRGVLEEAEAQEGRLQGSARDAVRVMTIHKAKGLDFEHVYLLQTHKRGRESSRSRQTELVSVGRDWEYQLLGYPSLGWSASLARRDEVDRHERVRLLYVALTRARQRVVCLGLRREGNGEAQSARAIADLLGPRSRTAGLQSKAQGCLDAGGASFVEAAGVPGDTALWRLLPLEDDGVGLLAKAPKSSSLVPMADLLAQEDVLAEHRRKARARMDRPLSRRASAGGHEELREEHSERSAEPLAPGTPGSPRMAGAPAAEIAMAVGSAVHAVLEHYDSSSPSEEAWQQALRHAGAELGDALGPEQLPAARQELAPLLERIRGGDLLTRLHDLGPVIVGREVPVLLAPEPGDENAPLGYYPGSIDLLYRDPQDGRIVVVDYKTDRAEDAQALATRAAKYREQGAIYQRAVREALRLPYAPRFELWFLRADHIEVFP